MYFIRHPGIAACSQLDHSTSSLQNNNYQQLSLQKKAEKLLLVNISYLKGFFINLWQIKVQNIKKQYKRSPELKYKTLLKLSIKLSVMINMRKSQFFICYRKSLTKSKQPNTIDWGKQIELIKNQKIASRQKQTIQNIKLQKQIVDQNIIKQIRQNIKNEQIKKIAIQNQISTKQQVTLKDYIQNNHDQKIELIQEKIQILTGTINLIIHPLMRFFLLHLRFKNSNQITSKIQIKNKNIEIDNNFNNTSQYLLFSFPLHQPYIPNLFSEGYISIQPHQKHRQFNLLEKVNILKPCSKNFLARDMPDFSSSFQIMSLKQINSFNDQNPSKNVANLKRKPLSFKKISLSKSPLSVFQRLNTSRYRQKIAQMRKNQIYPQYGLQPKIKYNSDKFIQKNIDAYKNSNRQSQRDLRIQPMTQQIKISLKKQKSKNKKLFNNVRSCSKKSFKSPPKQLTRQNQKIKQGQIKMKIIKGEKKKTTQISQYCIFDRQKKKSKKQKN